MGAGASTSTPPKASIAWRLEDVRKQLECQEELKKRLASKGLPPPSNGNFKTGLKQAHAAGAINDKMYSGYNKINENARTAKHSW